MDSATQFSSDCILFHTPLYPITPFPITVVWTQMLTPAPYPYDSIHINGRDVLIRHIISTTTIPQSAFETNTFSFIRDWFTGVETFGQLTSGSTGNPKEITISRDQMIASARMTAEAVGLQGGWNALLCLSPSYIAGKMMLVRSFVTGMKVIAVEPSANPFRK